MSFFENVLPRNLSDTVVFLLIFFCCTPFASAPTALVLGIISAQFVKTFPEWLNNTATQNLMRLSIVLLGFGANLNNALQVGRDGFLLSIVSITATLLLGLLLGKLFKLDITETYLITCGTAICGGSAIAAISSVIQSDKKQTTIALSTVFLLNSIGLFIYPPIGKIYGMTQIQFGTWAALGIHDTSSVVGAGAQYGNVALQLATTLKLSRALWIIPLSFMTMLFFRGGNKKPKIPYFILLYVAAMCINTFIYPNNFIFQSLNHAGKQGLIVSLFFVGTGLSPDLLRQVKINAFGFAVILWLIISVSLFWVCVRL